MSESRNSLYSSLFSYILTGIFLLVLSGAAIVLSTYYIVDAGEEAVITRFGKIDRIEKEGLHFIIPVIEEKNVYSMRTQVSYFTEKLLYSSDNLAATATIVVQYHVRDTPRLYERYRTIDNAVSSSIDIFVPSGVKAVFGSTSAEDNVRSRDELNQAMLAFIRDQMKDEPFEITSLEIRDVDFGPVFREKYMELVSSAIARRVASENAAAIVTTSDANAYYAEKMHGVFGQMASEFMVQKDWIAKWNGEPNGTLVLGNGNGGVMPVLNMGGNNN